MTETNPLPRQSSQAPVFSMELGAEIPGLWLPGPEGKRFSCGGGTWGRLILLCLGKMGQLALRCPACSQFGPGPGGRCSIRQSCPAVSVTTIQAQSLQCPAIIFGDFGVTDRSWRVSVTGSFSIKHFKCHIIQPSDTFEGRYL